jgi:hypothetical protein
MLVSPIQYCFLKQRVYADGLTSENLPPVSIGNRQISLYLKVNPPILTPATTHNAMVVHYLVNKNDIVKLAEEVGSYSSSSSNAAAGSIKEPNGLMKFGLSPLSATTQISTSSDLVSNVGGIHAAY